ncbi:glycosyltransferase family 2 protein [Alteribacter populi]|uniref:glycosyltransferase family 2 protein n=1 Tax=Alteribacter populi TaxID=2011011 RepID=UPI000BBAA3C0|nr:glycosyltransferase family 2 protein [Alteribacter populi]
MKKLTVFTPTYNRGYCLHNCYNSLVQQTNKDFVWLIIDDGSTDNTKELVNGWIAEDKIDIQYHRQKNQGMHGAHNTAYKLINTELNVCIDSDDMLAEGAVEKIVSFWSEHGCDKVSGMVGLDSYTNGKIIGSKFPEHTTTSTLFDLYNKYNVTGDKKLVYRTELTKKYPYPVFGDEKYVGLAYKYYKLDQEYKLLLMNETLCIVEYLPDGSSLNMLMQYYKNPKGFSFYRKELMKLPSANIAFKFRQAIHYVSSSLLDKNYKFISESPCKSLTLFAITPGIFLFFLIVTKIKIT